MAEQWFMRIFNTVFVTFMLSRKGLFSPQLSFLNEYNSLWKPRGNKILFNEGPMAQLMLISASPNRALEILFFCFCVHSYEIMMLTPPGELTSKPEWRLLLFKTS